jgi:flagellin-like hook-associated protein FlgL
MLIEEVRMTKNPFGEDKSFGPQRSKPFADAQDTGTIQDSLGRIENAARTVRRLKSQLGAEGLTLSATRELIDEVSMALEATARALRELDGR